MSQNLVPLDGGRTEIVTSVEPSVGVVLSNQYTLTKKLSPTPTEWVPGGRPIYDRLPAVSQRYKLYFGLDGDTAYTYIPPGNAFSGPGSMQVQSSGGNKFLTIQGGQIVWEYGKILVDPVIIDLEEVGMRSTRYFLGYQLFYDDSEFEAQYAVENFSLSGQEMNIGASTDSEPGWRYQPVFAFTDSESESWKNYDGLFPSYAGEAFLYWQTAYPNSYSSVTLRCPSNSLTTGSATLYYQTCPQPVEGEVYCSSPEWVVEQTVSVQRDENGQFFKFEFANPSPQTGWKVEWTDPKVSINRVEVSGVLTLKRKPATASSLLQLVAYPENAVPQSFTNSEGKEIPLVNCNLAYVDTNNVYEVTSVEDIRQTVSTDHEPIADWLTRSWDKNLTDLYTQVKNFPEYWMNPSSAMLQEYGNLTSFLVKVEK